MSPVNGTKWWVIEGLRTEEAVSPHSTPAEAPTPGSLLPHWEVRKPPNFLLFNEP